MMLFGGMVIDNRAYQIMLMISDYRAQDRHIKYVILKLNYYVRYLKPTKWKDEAIYTPDKAYSAVDTCKYKTYV